MYDIKIKNLINKLDQNNLQNFDQDTFEKKYYLKDCYEINTAGNLFEEKLTNYEKIIEGNYVLKYSDFLIHIYDKMHKIPLCILKYEIIEDTLYFDMSYYSNKIPYYDETLNSFNNIVFKILCEDILNFNHKYISNLSKFSNERGKTIWIKLSSIFQSDLFLISSKSQKQCDVSIFFLVWWLEKNKFFGNDKWNILFDITNAKELSRWRN